ncbi:MULTISPECIES: hypothetical protein [unclassified Streptomyces]|uniref:hypothetical protein n=1 Tax=unclassified Streptomyces TaxID=2593676 RepID=UPI002E779ADD|nr:hypothetical protein [Streptomyces sp. JV176]MEE1797436.1 hypothetical protein [Streptomyces sp. JV176]
MSEFKLGDTVGKDTRGFNEKPPPVVFQVQPDSYVALQTPEELRSWEQAVRMTTGLEIDADSLKAAVCGSESCRNCCTIDSCVDSAEQ